jgi:transcriptional antiterminator
MEEVLTMSVKKIDRLKIVSQLESKLMTVEEGSELMRISPRQIYRVLQKIKKEGSKGIIHKLRGKKIESRISRNFKKRSHSNI